MNAIQQGGSIMRRKSPDGSREEDLAWKAYEKIRTMIFMNEIGKGQKLNHRELVDRLNMSRTPIIQALKCMELQGLVRNEPNRGFYVSCLGLEELEDIFQLREDLELSLLRSLSLPLTEEQGGWLNSIFSNFIEAGRNGQFKKRLFHDMELHLAVAGMAGRAVSRQTLRDLLDRLYLRFEQETLFFRGPDTSEMEHRLFLDCLIAGDREKSGQALREHLRNTRAHAVQSYKQRLSEKESWPE
ncbi:MAG: hypothetical protein CSB33_01765 [Desulfobacterales bacterium]|nr:MAG: hypothetical protein CSB33_01765 [Desulfobacterales bacterium]